MGSEESHFNVSVGSDGQSHETVSTNRNLFEEKGAPKRYRTEGFPLTSLTPYRQAKPAHHAPLHSSKLHNKNSWQNGPGGHGQTDTSGRYELTHSASSFYTSSVYEPRPERQASTELVSKHGA